MENLNTNLIYLNDDMICGCNSKVFYCEKLNDKELKSIKNYIQNIDFIHNRLIMFPAWLNHCVDPNQSNEIRISVSFNFMQKCFMV